MCLTEKMCVLDSLWSGMRYSVVGRELDAKESTIVLNKMSLNRNTHRTRLYVHWSVDETAVSRGS